MGLNHMKVLAQCVDLTLMTSLHVLPVRCHGAHARHIAESADTMHPKRHPDIHRLVKLSRNGIAKCFRMQNCAARLRAVHMTYVHRN